MYNTVFVAGTFDSIHKGHTALLSKAFQSGKNVIIGLTSDEFVKKFKVQNSKLKIKRYDERKQALIQWLKKKNLIELANIVPIDDPHEPAASTIDVDALVVSTETRKRGEEINTIRQKRGLKELILLEVPMVVAQDQKSISSTRIRNGEIDHHGNLVMPDNLRPELRKPLGKFIAEIPKRDFVIAVGDVTTKAFLDAGRVPELMIIDRKVGRKPFTKVVLPSNVSILHVKSGPGFISKIAIQAIKAGLEKGPCVIDVEGEEDLLALPAIAEAPLGSFVYYGQPNEGMVEVEVTEEKKREVKLLLQKFLVR